MIKVRRRFDAIKVFALQVVLTSVDDRIEPLGHHGVDRTTRLPVALVGVVGAEDDDEGYGADQNTRRVRMAEGLFVIGKGAVDFPPRGEEEVNDDGKDAGQDGLVRCRTVSPGQQVQRVGTLVILNHDQLRN